MGWGGERNGGREGGRGDTKDKVWEEKGDKQVRDEEERRKEPGGRGTGSRKREERRKKKTEGLEGEKEGKEGRQSRKGRNVAPRAKAPQRAAARINMDSGIPPVNNQRLTYFALLYFIKLFSYPI